MDWIAHIEDFTGRLAAVGDRHDLETPVPTCGDWRLHDLLAHLLEVQNFWTHVVETRPAPPTDYVPPAQPDIEALADGLRGACRRLTAALRAAPPEGDAWSWSDDHTVGFTLRRQTHEAFVHLVDGLLAVGEPIPEIPAPLAADGVDEIITVMLTGVPRWAEFEDSGRAIELHATDTGDRWRVAAGRLTGTSPHSGSAVDQISHVVTDANPDATVQGSALELDLWLWRRGSDDSVKSDGDTSLASQLRETSAIL